MQLTRSLFTLFLGALPTGDLRAGLAPVLGEARVQRQADRIFICRRFVVSGARGRPSLAVDHRHRDRDRSGAHPIGNMIGFTGEYDGIPMYL